MMDSDGFVSDSDDDRETSHTGEGSGSSAIGLDLSRVIRHVDAPMSHRSAVRRSVHNMKATCSHFENYEIMADDLCSDAFDMSDYNMKLLTDVDIGRIFVGNGDLRRMLMADNARGSYLIILTDPKYTEPSIGRVGIVQVTPSIAEVLNSLKFEFMVNIRYPDDTMRMVPAKWETNDERQSIQFNLCGLDADDLEILVVSASADDLVFFDIHFAKQGVCLPTFIIMRASMTVGKFARAVLVDKVCIESILRRLYTPTCSSVKDMVPLESYTVSFEKSNADPGVKKMPSIITPVKDPDPSTLMGSAHHYSDRRDILFEKLQTPTVSAPWSSVTKNYKTSQGWYQLTPGKQLNRHFAYGAGLLTCDIFVNLDDTIHDTQKTLYSSVFDELMTKNNRHAKRACTQIIQMSRAVPDEFQDTYEAEYMTNDEGYADLVSEITKGKGVAAIDPFESLMMCYYVLHRYRSLFDPHAHAHVVIPPHVMDELLASPYTGQLAHDRLDIQQYISRYILDKLLKMEKDNQLERKVHLRAWTVECPLEFVGKALSKMIDMDVYDSIWAKFLIEKHEQKKRTAAMKAPVHGLLSRVSSSIRWAFPFPSCGLTKDSDH